jgi:hypothetical protein
MPAVLRERSKAGVRAHEQSVLDPCRRADRIVEDRPRRDVEHVGEQRQFLRRRAGQVLGNEP